MGKGDDSHGTDVLRFNVMSVTRPRKVQRPARGRDNARRAEKVLAQDRTRSGYGWGLVLLQSLAKRTRQGMDNRALLMIRQHDMRITCLRPCER